ncbi:apolipoprotein N-acyltransferase [Altererythrobacter atlanticus]|uniref:Apolipoprotein N-acyltransferase n=1 Tax=Croceibacterium atlanticum TaxID=1267766 RepID=A0A0F7KWS4_9SPHN|nr:apolipoprotein N-acyltransferase [Croceibacterium atlanticum]AKH43641.1 Apolipoprotein N-acyltransferase [Croceibacterium atlanticum]MBB5733875.1 apolipoprotein N-acyltransferase [Croceibacterium atlanticum]
MQRAAQIWQILLRHPRLSALLFGALAACGFRPIAIWPLALAAMAAFFALLAEARTARQAALWGWLFGMGHFTLANSWIATAFTYQAEMPAVLGWPAVPLLSLYLAIYPGLAALGAWAMAIGGIAPARRRDWALALAFAGCWILGELLRAKVFTGYAWDPFAMVLLGPFDRPGLAALSPWMGSYALSGLAVFLACGLAMLVRERCPVPLVLVSILLCVGMYLPAGQAMQGTLPFTLVQPDLRQERLNNPEFYEANFQVLAGLSRPGVPGEARIVLWPESGLADYLRPGYPQRYYDRMTALGSPEFARQRIGRVIGPDSVLLTGAVDLEIDQGRAIGAYNSVTALDGQGTILAGYSKAHLVPFGEYLPMREILEPLGLSRLVPGTIDFLPGPGPQTLDFGQLGRAGIQICYEIVFSGEVVDPANRPDYIFNPSNDGWFGAFGPPQHLAQARMRALEEGLPVLRSTTTGISAIIDARGVVREHLAMHEAGRLDGKVPPAAPPTLFSRMGNILAIVWAGLFLAGAFVAMRRRAL